MNRKSVSGKTMALKNAGVGDNVVMKQLKCCRKSSSDVMKRFQQIGTTLSKPIHGHSRSVRTKGVVQATKKKMQRKSHSSL